MMEYLIKDMMDGCGWNRQEAVAIVEAIRHAQTCPEFQVKCGSYLQELLKRILK